MIDTTPAAVAQWPRRYHSPVMRFLVAPLIAAAFGWGVLYQTAGASQAQVAQAMQRAVEQAVQLPENAAAFSNWTCIAGAALFLGSVVALAGSGPTWIVWAAWVTAAGSALAALKACTEDTQTGRAPVKCSGKPVPLYRPTPFGKVIYGYKMTGGCIVNQWS